MASVDTTSSNQFGSNVSDVIQPQMGAGCSNSGGTDGDGNARDTERAALIKDCAREVLRILDRRAER